MVDIPKDGNGDGTMEDDPSKKQPKRPRQRLRSELHQQYIGDSSTADNITPESAEEIQRPPTTHFVATVDDLTDMLDFDSDDIDGMDGDVGDKHELVPIGHWTATSSHYVYMVDTPKGSDDEEQRDVTRDHSLEKQSKRRRKRRSKSRLDKDSSHTDPAIEQGKPVDDEHAIEQPFEQDNLDK